MTSPNCVIRRSVAVSMQALQDAGCQTKTGVEFPDDDAQDDDDDKRTAAFWQDAAGDGRGETTGARDCPGRGRKRRGRGDYVSRLGARSPGGGGRVGAA